MRQHRHRLQRSHGAREWPDHGRVRGRARSHRHRRRRCTRRALRLDLRRPRHRLRPDLDPASTAGRSGSRLLPAPNERGAGSAPLSRFPAGHTARAWRRAPPDLSQPARRRGARAHGRRDPDRRRERPARAGPWRDRDRAARPPAARRVVPRSLQRPARLHRAARAGGREGRRRLRRQLPARPAVGERAAHAVRPAHGRAAGRDRRRRA